MTRFDGWKRPACFAGLHLLMLIFGLGVVSFFVVDHLAEETRAVAVRRQTLDRMQGILSSRIQIERAGDAAEKMLSAVFIPGENPSAQDTELSLKLQDYFRQNNVSFNSITLLEPRDGRGARFAGARVEVAALSEDLARTLAKIESGWPFMIVQTAALRPDDASNRGERISATLEIFGATSWQER